MQDQRTNFEMTLRGLRQSLVEKDNEIRDQAELIDQLERDNFDCKLNLEKQTDQILKLELALQQQNHHYNSQ